MLIIWRKIITIEDKDSVILNIYFSLQDLVISV